VGLCMMCFRCVGSFFCQHQDDLLMLDDFFISFRGGWKDRRGWEAGTSGDMVAICRLDF